MNGATDAPMPLTRRDWLAAAALATVTFAVFAPALGCDFVNYDDPDYVTRNPHVTAGLGGGGIRWAFTAFHTYNWHPLTWLSLQLDASLYGPNPRGFHLTNVLLHSVNAAVLFLALRCLTGAFARSAIVALLFAIHPLRVESVTWISERKDVLSAFFGFLALLAYANYGRRPSGIRYAVVLVAFVLSLLSKPMFVTLPCLFLVLDWWPLGRNRSRADANPKSAGPSNFSTATAKLFRARSTWSWLAVEKVPLLALSVVSAVITSNAQYAGGAVSSLDRRFRCRPALEMQRSATRHTSA